MMVNKDNRSFQYWFNYYRAVKNASSPADFSFAIVKFFFEDIEPSFVDEKDQLLWDLIRPHIACSRRQSDRGQGAPAGNENNPRGDNQYSGGQSRGQSGGQSRGQSGGQSRGQSNRNRNRSKKNEIEESNSLFVEEANAQESTTGLSLPYSSQMFCDVWMKLCQQPSWIRKSLTALQESLDELGAYPEEFAIFLMRKAIANSYQGVVYTSTQKEYEAWRENNREQYQQSNGSFMNKEDIV